MPSLIKIHLALLNRRQHPQSNFGKPSFQFSLGTMNCRQVIN